MIIGFLLTAIFSVAFGVIAGFMYLRECRENGRLRRHNFYLQTEVARMDREMSEMLDRPEKDNARVIGAEFPDEWLEQRIVH